MTNRVARSVLAEHFAPRDVEQQLVILHRMRTTDGLSLKAFVVARGRQDFTDDDVRVATALQPLVLLLDRQAAACGGLDSAGPTHGLTGRELAVLRLLDRGLTAAAIGARLGISERTVHRHLQHVYRKLDAHDRLGAVLNARAAHLVPSSECGGARPAP